MVRENTVMVEDCERVACTFIRQLAHDLDFPTTCTCSSLAIFHFYREARAKSENHCLDEGGKSLLTPGADRAKSPVEWIKIEAGACVLIATKANEVQRKVRDVVNVVHQRARPDSKPLDVGSTFWDLRDAIVAAEQDVLRLLGFSIKPELPFVFLLNYLKALSATPQVASAAHALLVESFDLPLCLRHSPHTIAAACISLASLFFDFPLPSSPDIKWNQVIAVDDEELDEVGAALLDLLEPRAAAFATLPDLQAEADKEANKLRLWLQSRS